MAEVSMKDQAVLLNGNFYKNRKEEIAGNVDALADRFAGKDVYIVAAGPSLDKNFMLLKDINHNSVICIWLSYIIFNTFY